MLDDTSAWANAYARRLVPVAYADTRFEESDPAIEKRNTAAWAAMREWRGGNLWVAGPYGTGKTFASACLLNRELLNGRTGAFLRGTELCRSPFDAEIKLLVRDCTRVDLLILEDLDKGSWSAPAVEALFALTDARRNKRELSGGRKGHTIITCNITGREFCAHLDSLGHGLSGGAIYDRIKPCRPVLFAGESNRSQQYEAEGDTGTTPTPESPGNVVPMTQPHPKAQAQTDGLTTEGGKQ